MRTLLLFLALTLPLIAQEPAAIKLTPSPETTYLIEPLLPDGRIDYAAALNKKLSAQTTPEKNLIAGAFVIFPGETEWGIIRNPDSENTSTKNYRERFWKMMGFDAPPPIDSLVDIAPFDRNADYEKELLKFYSQEELDSMIAQEQESEKQRYKKRLDDGLTTQKAYNNAISEIETDRRAMCESLINHQWWETYLRPWTAKEFPYHAHWLESTGELTQKLMTLSKERTGYYHPWLTYDEDFTMVQEGLLPYAQSLRGAARLFGMRGNLDFTQGKLDDAFECAFSSLRMGQTMRRGGGCVVEDFIGLALTGMGNERLTTYLAALPKETKAEWILQKKKEYDAVSMEAIPLYGGELNPPWFLGERLAALSFIQILIENPEKAKAGFWWDEVDRAQQGYEQYEKLFLTGTKYDWNEVAKRVNHFYDDWEDIYALPDWPHRFRAMKRLVLRAVEARERSVDSDDSPEQRAAGFIAGNFIPAYEAVMYAVARGDWEHRAVNLGFALAAYRADNGGKNPDTLEQLVPKYIESVPNSPHTGKPMRYIKREHDVLITNDDAYKLDGSEEEIEQKIAETRAGGRIQLTMEQLIYVVMKD